MTLFIGKRLFSMTIVLAIVSLVVFAAFYLLPSNTAHIILGQYATPEGIAALEKRLGLNDPFLVQYWRWLGAFLQGDFGTSLSMNRPNAPMIWAAISKSLILAVFSLIIVSLVGIAIGTFSAIRAGRPLDYVLSNTSYLGIAVPEFLWAIVMILLFGSYLRWLPVSGYAEPGEGLSTFISHLVLPVATLVLALVAQISRQTRSGMLDVLSSSYVRTARSKGLPETVVIVRHALRNALLPTITVIAQSFGWLIGSIVVVEIVFSFPGIGRLLVFGVQRHDVTLVQPIVLLITFAFMLSSLLADIAYVTLNPRIRLGGTVD